MLKLGKLTDWIAVQEGDEAIFDATTPRRVKVEIRTLVRENVFISIGEDDPRFLCVVDGYENVEFFVDGPFTLAAEGPMFVRSVDSARLGMENTDEEIFTKMHDRPAIAPEIAAMQRVVARNMERMRAQMFADVQGMVRSTERENKRRAAAAEAAERAAADAARERASGDGQSSGTGSADGGDKSAPKGDADKK